MKYRTYIILCLLAFSIIDGYSQKKISKVKMSKYESPEAQLDRARRIYEESPTEAIEIINGLLSEKSKASYLINGEAFFLLGKIYDDIDQLDLAMKRYNMALKYVAKKDGDQKARIYYRLGAISLEKEATKDAERYFEDCILWAIDDQILRKCQNGKVDILILQNQNSAALEVLDDFKEKYSSDSIAVVQIESRKAQAYSQMNDVFNAANSIQNAYNSIPQNVTLQKDDYKPVIRAQDKIFSNVSISNTDKIDIQSNIKYRNSNFEGNVARENFRISKVYEEENNDDGVLTSLENSKKFIDESSDAELVADVFKMSYEYNLKKGRSELAFADLDKYVKAKEQSIVDLENDLKQEIEIVKGQKSIDESISEQALEEKDRDLMQSQLSAQRILIGFLSLLVLASLVFFYFLNRNIKAKRRANQLLELKSLRTQMNPHFIFNALNSVNNFIAKNDEKSANKYLSEFSHLMRMVLDYSKRDFITLREEIELNQLYLKLEHFRFRDKFEYTFDADLQGDNLDLEVPPMLIQPFIENAVWHGLRYKEDKGSLRVHFEKKGEIIEVVIEDDGIGRSKSKEMKTKNQLNHKSTGLDNVKNRLKVLNATYGKDFKVDVMDLDAATEDTGTKVVITLPITE